jgi:hypothetical protein
MTTTEWARCVAPGPANETALACAARHVLAAIDGEARLGGAGARERLDETRAWLILHNGAVMAALFLVFAALLISQGLGLRS